MQYVVPVPEAYLQRLHFLNRKDEAKDIRLLLSSWMRALAFISLPKSFQEFTEDLVNEGVPLEITTAAITRYLLMVFVISTNDLEIDDAEIFSYDRETDRTGLTADCFSRNGSAATTSLTCLEIAAVAPILAHVTPTFMCFAMERALLHNSPSGMDLLRGEFSSPPKHPLSN